MDNPIYHILLVIIAILGVSIYTLIINKHKRMEE